MGGVRAIAFDFNGTLSHDEPVLLAIYQQLFAEHGRPLTAAEYFDTLAGNTEEAIVGGWLGVEGAELERLVAERSERYRAAADGSTVSAATRAAVRHAAERVPVVVVSGANRREIEPVVDAAGLTDCFRAIVAADDVVHGKPHPEGYLLAASLLAPGVDPASIIAFEDTEAGIASAKAAGLRCVGVRGTLPDERLGAADLLVDRIDADLIRSLVG